jgi:hypothetical protein
VSHLLTCAGVVNRSIRPWRFDLCLAVRRKVGRSDIAWLASGLAANAISLEMPARGRPQDEVTR